MSPLCEHVGSLCDDVDCHDHHRDGTDPLAHHPVTSLYISGPVRFPVGLRLYRRDEELTQWEAAVAKGSIPYFLGHKNRRTCEE